MTLHDDLAALLAEAAVLDVDIDEAVADEHVRVAAYLRVIAVTAAARSRDRDRATVAAIVRDPYESGARTAVVALVDSIALKSSGPEEFRRWTAELLPETDRLTVEGHRAFVRRRIEDWLLHLSVEEGRVPTRDELAEATHWMQRRLADKATSPAVLALLAESGTTRKIRNTAKNRAGSREPRNR
ncbi:hypothetical protein ACFYVL_02370 [Streptomyces sp. NPDC004111]|uniref:hypothetical protein n=1 Tax=Streptomyces sp. NPDC004111 TaxID=3364690 RepID=UPI0036A50F0E